MEATWLKRRMKISKLFENSSVMLYNQVNMVIKHLHNYFVEVPNYRISIMNQNFTFL